MSNLGIEDLAALEPGTRVLRTHRWRVYRWVKQEDGEWKLDGHKVWLTPEEMMAAQAVKLEMNAENVAAMKAASKVLAEQFPPGSSAQWEDIVKVAAPVLQAVRW